jgi:hypothetical protein
VLNKNDLAGLVDLKDPSDIQVGLPTLANPGSPTHYEVMRQWLEDCDSKHRHDEPQIRSAAFSRSHDATTLPTRLLVVGRDEDDTVRLWEPQPGDTGSYTALSHPWGQPPFFCTFSSNLEDHTLGMSLGDFPATFRDAVRVTRALGIPYLWIDSLCIVQGPDGDFQDEAKRMEQVFSSAYCVLAASCALGQADGFLKPRRERDYVPLRRAPNEAPFYVCELIDDFNGHVLESRLNSRGWVLQEHALARRTIFFTEHQTYWECGAGVRCESGTRMSK